MEDELLNFKQLLRSIVHKWHLFLDRLKDVMPELFLLSDYTKVVAPSLFQHKYPFRVIDAMRFYFPWVRTMKSRNPMKDALPWLPFPAIRHLEDLIGKDTRVFEYGAGGSSVFFAKRVKELVSVEHDKTWFEQTKIAMKDVQRQYGIRWTGILAEAEPQNLTACGSPKDPLAYTSSDKNYAGHVFHNYAAAIDTYPNEYFDIVLIDGRARPSCFLHAINKVKLGGYVILDNAEREDYSYIEDEAKKLALKKHEFWGPGPYNRYCWRTIFMKRQFS